MRLHEPSAAGDVTGVAAGAGLTGGGTAGEVTLAVAFGTGAGAVAEGSHGHAHAALTGIGANDHHAQQHALVGPDHTVSGLTAGQALRATGATSTGFGTLAQAVTHDAADTDAGSSSLHHTLGTGANQAAAGNHTHGATQVLLSYEASTDLANGAVLVANTWTDLTANQSFTVQNASSKVLVLVGGSCWGQNPAAPATLSSRIVVDAAGTPTIKPLGGQPAAASEFGSFLAGASGVVLTGLSAGAHTVKVQVRSTQASTVYCRAASFPEQEFLAIRALELKP